MSVAGMQEAGFRTNQQENYVSSHSSMMSERQRTVS
jgi:hypothetical protein